MKPASASSAGFMNTQGAVPACVRCYGSLTSFQCEGDVIRTRRGWLGDAGELVMCGRFVAYLMGRRCGARRARLQPACLGGPAAPAPDTLHARYGVMLWPHVPDGASLNDGRT